MYAANPLPWHGRPPLPKYFSFGGLIFFNVCPPSYKPVSSPKQVENKLKQVIHFTVYAYFSCISPIPWHSRTPPVQIGAFGVFFFFNIGPPSYCTGVVSQTIKN